ncbi:MAG: 1,4-alpha-glucan branching protein GlgB [Gemmatimonadetes bacterium]|nr:1,4-alpha-glucan branching protein GlgB [Gemmatimonadota bacterium]
MTGSAGPARFGSGSAPTASAPFDAAVAALLAGDHADPHVILGPHPATTGAAAELVVRVFHPDADAAELVLETSAGGAGAEAAALAMRPVGGGLFEAGIPAGDPSPRYRVRFRFGTAAIERDDPYRFAPVLGELDLYLIRQGTHQRLWDALGAHRCVVDGVQGVHFAVWAPNARRVSVVGDFCRWDGRLFPMRNLAGSGVFELFVPGLAAGALYKFEIRTREGALRLKSDPLGFSMEVPPGTASRVTSSSYLWGDGDWMADRVRRDVTRLPMAVYEVHLGSWARIQEEGNRPLTYREIAPRLVEHVKRLGFTHMELLPVAEHPFAGSWGYQVTGFYAPTSRYGTPDDFRFLVDHCHAEGIGVILDWVPAHFPKDDFALRRFDGTALYEHPDPRRGEHPDWGTLIFDYGRNEVRNFLVANALYWLEEFHVDGLRVDAVASMLYLDYSRPAGQWLPNRWGGRENVEALEFVRALNEAVRQTHPGCFTVAEESTAWPAVTRPVAEGGLGFAFKWNMGWMHDTLRYFARDPVHRRWHQDEITFAMLYERSERFLMPLSHDEVVHGKGSLLARMPGDAWRRFANLRVLLAYQYTRPGKKLLFMGTELAPWGEWNHDDGLDWTLGTDPLRAGFARFLEELGALYLASPCLWRSDDDPEGFHWIDCSDRDNSVLSYARRDGDDHLMTVLNLTPSPLPEYRLGAPAGGSYARRLCSDEPRYGGSGYATDEIVTTEPVAAHGLPHSLRLKLPPLSAIVLAPLERPAPQQPPAG